MAQEPLDPSDRELNTQLVTSPSTGTIEPQKAIDSLYYSIVSQRVTDRPIILQFVSPGVKAGTTHVAAQFASFAARAQGGAALLVDCTIATRRKLLAQGSPRPGLLNAVSQTGRIDSAIEEAEGLSYARLFGDPEPAVPAAGNLTLSVMEQVRGRFLFTALDTPSLDSSSMSLTLARLCDGVVLVVEADVTKSADAEAAAEAIERSQGKLLGLVFNKRRFYAPLWLRRRL